MSLLQRGTETVAVYPETVVTDSDGNKFTRPGSVGVVVKASVQPISATESADGGFNTKSRYRLRLIGYPSVLGAQSQVEWNGKRWSIDGEPQVFNGSRRTAHVEYVMVRG
uniref:Head-to-tail stopper n=1 Tax=Mycolicibacterium phage Alyssa1 TaxID=3240801 RepID=A0AB39U1W5_9CAUD